MHRSLTVQSASGVALSLAGVYVCGWGVYYAAQDTLRRRAIRQRSRQHPLPARPRRRAESIAALEAATQRAELPARPRSASSSKPAEAAAGSASSAGRPALPRAPLTAPSSWYGGASAADRAAIRSRFAPLRILGRFVNPLPEWREQGAWEVVLWKAGTSFFNWPPRIWWDGGLTRDKWTETGRRRIETLLPVEPLDEKLLFSEKGKQPEGLSYTWIGQSTTLLQMHGLTILTDPVMGEQPVKSVFAPKRMRPLPCQPESLRGRVDVVVLSHNHFDHLSLDMIPVLSDAHWIVPFGVRALLEQNGLRPAQITELSWWESTTFTKRVTVRRGASAVSEMRSLTVHAAPAMHWTARSPLDTNQSLWCSYVLKAAAPDAPAIDPATFFFCCDSGYSRTLFESIGRALGPVDAAAIPIGSYAPRWHMAMQHGNPHDAVLIAQDVGARSAVGMHWGTFQMSDERWDAPPADLALALQREGLPADYFTTTPFGRTRAFPVAPRQPDAHHDTTSERA